MSNPKSDKITSIFFSNETTYFGVYRYPGLYVMALIRNIALLYYNSHGYIKETFKFMEVFDDKIICIFKVYCLIIGVIVSLLHLFFFLMVLFHDDSSKIMFPVLGRNDTGSIKKVIMGLSFILSYLLCVDSFVSWLFIFNLKKEFYREKVYDSAPSILRMQETSDDLEVDPERVPAPSAVTKDE
jgi:hypothetical protein